MDYGVNASIRLCCNIGISTQEPGKLYRVNCVLRFSSVTVMCLSSIL